MTYLLWLWGVSTGQAKDLNRLMYFVRTIMKVNGWQYQAVERKLYKLAQGA